MRQNQSASRSNIDNSIPSVLDNIKISGEDMRIEINLLSHLKQYLPKSQREKESVFVDVTGNPTVKEILVGLGIPSYIPKVVIINDKKGHLQDVVTDGDKVTVCALTQGG